MTKQKIGFFSLLTIITSLIIVIALLLRKEDANQAKSNTDVFELMEIKHQTNSVTSSFTGQITSDEIVEVIMDVTGKISLDSPILKEGEQFKKGEIIVKLDRLEILFEILEKRARFKLTVIESLPMIDSQFPEEKLKWEQYGKMIHRTDFIPDLPQMNSVEEKSLINKRGIDSRYYEIKKLENLAENYFYTAPFDGFVVKNKIRKEQQIIKNQSLMEIAPNNSLIVKTQIPLSNINDFKNDDLIDIQTIEDSASINGRYLRTGHLTQDSLLVEVHYKIENQNNILFGKLVEVSPKSENILKETGVLLPQSAIKEDKVHLFIDNQILRVEVTTLSNLGDSVLVDGLPEHCFVILNP